ncbi:hypothetical protein IG631_00862 [Alternaria alternata]|nr:hypothetical protein IG631_00862 [Alternaria alternata]
MIHGGVTMTRKKNTIAILIPQRCHWWHYSTIPHVECRMSKHGGDLGGSGVRSSFRNRRSGLREVIDSVSKVCETQTFGYIRRPTRAERLCDADSGLVICCGAACLKTLSA